MCYSTYKRSLSTRIPLFTSQDALQFWFDKNVDGFIFSGVDYIFEPREVDVAIGNRRRRQALNTTETPPDPTMVTEPEPTTAAEPEPEPGTPSGGGSGLPVS